MASNVSVLKFYSMGVVAAVKSTNSKEIQVIPRETAPMMSGEAEVNPQVITHNGKTSSGDSTQDKVVTDSTIAAIWFPFRSNRVTAPDVVKGERVVIWQIGDEDKYYWTETGLDDDLRRLETIIIALSGSPATTEDKNIGEGDWYFIEWSSHKKHFMMSNSKMNGEQVQYVIKADYGEAIFSLADDLDNNLVLNSLEALWQITNTDKCLITMSKKNIEIIAQENFNLTAQELISMLCKTMKITANESFELITNKTTINSPGGISMIGDIDHNGHIETSGGLNTPADVVAAGISLTGHLHGGVQKGGSETGGPV
ncbi:putative structural protein [Erwinia phage vB_EamM_RAY]|uniref:Structural protein n=7 Tax=Agricanvirus TaxID=1984776 RepID=A0A173GDR9_9CAUD|nr:baseplate assembly protein [Erwinia phage Ea35-70]YP_009605488.1 baseplate assembly protein [Erwinia phage vB_EamM_RAY]YP_009605806.1 baseplate assembly protein [Erwinia phage vB_EamM_Simmy50]YP_009606127.1 baseplate assembly protein [Erwinia phage vB_EamM_Special G]AUG85809.1 putative structural protein [Erwinia phage vB_EamM_Bosolaphorus]AUG86449.1 putative structural protein [Erwinia phage vB_EamM_MadMel]QBP07129.1 putative structural protein [Erwinia phage Rebecca]AHI60171.1 hypotheti